MATPTAARRFRALPSTPTKYVKVDGQWLIEDTGYLRVYEESFQRDKTHRIRINMFRPKKKKVIKKK